jgi:hypothetical protein
MSIEGYHKQRYERLCESIAEYLDEQGSDSGSKALLRDIQLACIELRAVHEEFLDNYNHVHDFFQ